MKAKLSIEDGYMVLSSDDEGTQTAIDFYLESESINMYPIDVDVEVLVDGENAAIYDGPYGEIGDVWLEVELANDKS